MPKISVVIPVYNTPTAYFHTCMQSVLEQSFKDYEVLLVDDGSTNGAEKLCDEYAQKDVRFRVIHQPNKGVSAARNAGIRAAHGEYMIFLDPDDWWHRKTLESLYEKASQENLDILLFWEIDYLEKTGEYVDRGLPKEAEGEFFVASAAFKDDLKIGLLDKRHVPLPICTGSSCQQLVRREVQQKNSIFYDEKLHIGEDLVFIMYP